MSTDDPQTLEHAASLLAKAQAIVCRRLADAALQQEGDVCQAAADAIGHINAARISVEAFTTGRTAKIPYLL